MKRIAVLLVIATLGLSSCENKLKKELDEQQDRLMTLHDEVMPKSMRTDKLKADLQSFAQETEDDSIKNIILVTSMSLQKANDDMYMWMKNFGVAMNETPDLETKKELYDELELEITRIKEETNEQIDTANKILEK